ncbi:MAG: hypothetical protein FJ318_10075 [SAR202 cluster bacterium]|nr:hypothetical protein [SAR202 cluster bacterium]
MNDLLTMLWKERKDLIMQGGRAGLLRPAAMVAILGVLLPWQAGAGWLSLPWLGVGALAYAPFFVVVMLVVDAFAGERERHTLETLLATRMPDAAIIAGKIGALVLYALAVMTVSLALGLVVANVTADGPTGFYPLHRVALLYALALGVDLLGAGAGVIISMRASTVRQAQQTMSFGLTVFAFAAVIALRALPDSLTGGGSLDRLLFVGAASLLALDALVLGVVAQQFRRSRLIVG